MRPASSCVVVSRPWSRNASSAAAPDPDPEAHRGLSPDARRATPTAGQVSSTLNAVGGAWKTNGELRAALALRERHRSVAAKRQAEHKAVASRQRSSVQTPLPTPTPHTGPQPLKRSQSAGVVPQLQNPHDGLPRLPAPRPSNRTPTPLLRPASRQNAVLGSRPGTVGTRPTTSALGTRPATQAARPGTVTKSSSAATHSDADDVDVKTPAARGDDNASVGRWERHEATPDAAGDDEFPAPPPDAMDSDDDDDDDKDGEHCDDRGPWRSYKTDSDSSGGETPATAKESRPSGNTFAAPASDTAALDTLVRSEVDALAALFEPPSTPAQHIADPGDDSVAPQAALPAPEADFADWFDREAASFAEQHPIDSGAPHFMHMQDPDGAAMVPYVRRRSSAAHLRAFRDRAVRSTQSDVPVQTTFTHATIAECEARSRLWLTREYARATSRLMSTVRDTECRMLTSHRRFQQLCTTLVDDERIDRGRLAGVERAARARLRRGADQLLAATSLRLRTLRAACRTTELSPKGGSKHMRQRFTAEAHRDVERMRAALVADATVAVKDAWDEVRARRRGGGGAASPPAMASPRRAPDDLCPAISFHPAVDDDDDDDGDNDGAHPTFAFETDDVQFVESTTGFGGSASASPSSRDRLGYFDFDHGFGNGGGYARSEGVASTDSDDSALVPAGDDSATKPRPLQLAGGTVRRGKSFVASLLTNKQSTLATSNSSTQRKRGSTDRRGSRAPSAMATPAPASLAATSTKQTGEAWHKRSSVVADLVTQLRKPKVRSGDVLLRHQRARAQARAAAKHATAHEQGGVRFALQPELDDDERAYRNLMSHGTMAAPPSFAGAPALGVRVAPADAAARDAGAVVGFTPHERSPSPVRGRRSVTANAAVDAAFDPEALAEWMLAGTCGGDDADIDDPESLLPRNALAMHFALAQPEPLLLRGGMSRTEMLDAIASATRPRAAGFRGQRFAASFGILDVGGTLSASLRAARRSKSSRNGFSQSDDGRSAFGPAWELTDDDFSTEGAKALAASAPTIL